mgnify:CR=1 FL=1
MGVDIGGTFTDVVLEIRDHLSPVRQFSTKVLTTYLAPEDAIISGMQQVCDQAEITPACIDQIIHGTTLATNALIERRGAKTALITTEGFRDVIEMRSESRFEQYDLNLVLPEPLLPRQQRFTLKERISASGEILIALEANEVEALAETIRQAGFESIAVGFIHAYQNNIHETRVRDILAKCLPGVSISLSSEVSPQMREYERFNTVVANAFIKPMMKSYLDKLRGQLQKQGFIGSVFLMHSGGGIISIESAAEFPVRLVESGPAGGAVFAAHIASRYGLDKVLSFDMGGTTAKICLIKNQTPRTSRVFEVARTYRFKKGSGMPISVPVIDMVEIGAGGGSLAHVDAMRQIRVGPESAGSEPGPACYSRGGVRPAVTDADLVLGKLDPDNFAGGSIELDRQSASSALEKTLGIPLDLETEMAAYGLCEVVDENMANAARVHAVENGEDLTDYTMIAFGGAAPLHAGRLCEKLGVKRLLIPPGAGVGSAIGFLRAPFSFEANRSLYTRLTDFNPDPIRTLLAELETEATGFVRSCDANAAIQAEFKAYMRYSGQGEEIPVTLSREQAMNPDAQSLKQKFEQDYTALFGRVVEGMNIEITVWSVNATTKAEKAEPVAALFETAKAAIDRQRNIFDPAAGSWVKSAVIHRNDLQPGSQVSGPAAITEDETTIILPSSRQAVCRSDGCIDVSEQASEAVIAQDSSSDVASQVMWNRLISVVEEQAQALIRTAFSASVREAGDLSAGIYDRTGQMLAQAVTGTPGHVNAMADAVAHFIRRIGYDHIFKDDVYITNDPWEGTGHLHDITVVSPSFYQNKLVGFLACTAHIVDIGGRGFGADADSIYEEGLYLPIMKFAEKGIVDKTLINLVRANVREPDQAIGDFYALASCNEIGHRRLSDMMGEFHLTDLTGITTFIMEHSRRATLECIAALPRASAKGCMTIDGYSSPVDLKVSLAIQADRVLCDFTGTSGLDKKGINVPLVYTKAYACYALKCAIAPVIPNNAASLAPFEISAPIHSIVNAVHPAPVALRHIIGHMIPDAVYDALEKILPNTIPAEGAGTLCNFQLSIRPRTDIQAPDHAVRAEVLTFNSGGSGARPHADGMNATAFPSGVKTMPVEATEHTGPVIIWRKELRPDSGGAGQYRGGLGQFMEVGTNADHEFDFSAMFDRVDHPARGRQGGKNGAATTIHLDDGSLMKGKGKQFVPSGRRVMLAFPGGAGYGKPADRAPQRVRKDLEGGYISAAVARQEYGLSDVEIAVIQNAVKNGKAIT